MNNPVPGNGSHSENQYILLTLKAFSQESDDPQAAATRRSYCNATALCCSPTDLTLQSASPHAVVRLSQRLFIRTECHSLYCADLGSALLACILVVYDKLEQKLFLEWFRLLC